MMGRGGAPVRNKYWCEPCDNVAKSAQTPTCPTCTQPMRAMGRIWKPGPKGNRMRNYGRDWPWGEPSPRSREWAEWLKAGREKRRVRGKIRSWR